MTIFINQSFLTLLIGSLVSVWGLLWRTSDLCEYPPSALPPVNLPLFGFFVYFNPSLLSKNWILFSI